MEIKDYTHYVQYYETDRMGVTHHSNYIRWMEEARVDFLKQIGWDYAKLEEEGIISPVVNVSCKYKESTTFNDVVTVRASIAEFNGIKLKIKYEMHNAEGKAVSEGISEHCFVSKDGKIIHVKRDYPDFYKALSELVKK